jgi:hypothetical protein
MVDIGQARRCLEVDVWKSNRVYSSIRMFLTSSTIGDVARTIGEPIASCGMCGQLQGKAFRRAPIDVPKGDWENFTIAHIPMHYNALVLKVDVLANDDANVDHQATQARALRGNGGSDGGASASKSNKSKV